MRSKITPKDFFLHLGATIALYASAGALIDLSYAIINKALPDPLSSSFSPSSIVWPVSMLVVLVPILYGLEWLIARDIARLPEKKDVWVRRWRIYLTLFLAVALIGGDLIALINFYLNGEITARFIWKVVAILLIAGAIGKYYFFSISDKWKHAGLMRKGNAWFGLILAAGAVVGGFLIVGSPATQRAERFDEQRVSDLMNIQYQVIDYWQQHGALPAQLGDLDDAISGFSVPADPDTQAPYGYSVEAPQSFELCATFSLPATASDGTDPDWTHAAGYVCFDRTVDAQQYPVLPQAAKAP